MRVRRSGSFAVNIAVVLALVLLIALQGYPAWSRMGSPAGVLPSAAGAAPGITPSASTVTAGSQNPAGPATGPSAAASPSGTAAPARPSAPGSPTTPTSPSDPSGTSRPGSGPVDGSPGDPAPGWPIAWPESDPLAMMGLKALDPKLPDPRTLDVPDSIRAYPLPVTKGYSTSWIPKSGLAATPDYTGPIAYLTFDDGPSYTRTPKILSILKAHGIKATFFVIGRNITPPLYPVIWRCHLEGHAIGNHTYDHADGDQSLLHFRHSVALTSELVQRITGYRTTLFRFPGGSSSFSGRKAFKAEGFDWLSDNGYQYFDWNSSTGDGNSRAGYTAEQLVDNASRTVPIARSSGHDIIVLAHDSSYSRDGAYNDIVGALPLLIRKIASRGYRFGILTADGYTVQFGG